MLLTNTNNDIKRGFQQKPGPIKITSTYEIKSPDGKYFSEISILISDWGDYESDCLRLDYSTVDEKNGVIYIPATNYFNNKTLFLKDVYIKNFGFFGDLDTVGEDNLYTAVINYKLKDIPIQG